VSPEILAALEALLFASDAPLELGRIAEVLELAPDEAQAAVGALRTACDASGRGLAVVEVAGGIRLVTRPEHAPVLLRLQRLRLRTRLSRAAVETLAIVAYRQPVSRPEIEQLRGVSAESVVTHLLERRLIRIVGRRAAPGRPILYGTSREFLEHFGLRDLGELPPLEVPAGAAGAGEAPSPSTAPVEAPAGPEPGAEALAGADAAGAGEAPAAGDAGAAADADDRDPEGAPVPGA
jgi:segregation and condensation protein B